VAGPTSPNLDPVNLLVHRTGSAETAATALEAAVEDQGGELARAVAELASAAKLGNVTIQVVNTGDLATANVLRLLK
jgi:hypothetical protein